MVDELDGFTDKWAIEGVLCTVGHDDELVFNI